jgi:hypothetical protein
MGDKTGYVADHGQGTIGGYAHGFNEPGLRNVGSYQVSGHPFITGSGSGYRALDRGKVHMVKFPYVCKSFTVINPNDAGQELRVHFQSGSGTTALTIPGYLGVQSISDNSDVIHGCHFITIDGGASVTFDAKCKQFYISQNHASDDDLEYQVFAELTNISTSRMYHLTGSGITEAYKGDD